MTHDDTGTADTGTTDTHPQDDHETVDRDGPETGIDETEDGVDETEAGVDETEAVEAFRHLGLSKYEAQVFIALATLESGTARDVDRVADVPRSQVYGAAESLEGRGLVEIQQSNPIRYRAVDLDGARDRLRDRLDRHADRAFAYVERAREEYDDTDAERQEGVWTVQGRDTVSARVSDLVEAAEDRVLYVTPAALLDPDVVATLEARADEGDVDVWVLAVDDAVATAFAEDSSVSVAPFTGGKDETAGRLLAVDGDTVLLSVADGEGEPGTGEETAIWSSETGFAAVFLELVGSHLGDAVETKL